MDERTRRVGLNEALFRNVNEEIRSLAEEAEQRSPRVLCECGDETCVEEIPVAPDDYERVRADGALFILAPGHESPEIEDVVQSRGDFNVVRKHEGLPAQLARSHDSRTQSIAAITLRTLEPTSGEPAVQAAVSGVRAEGASECDLAVA